MKKVFAVLMCVVILCMTMCITAFAAESGAIVIEKDVVDGQQLENGHTYVFEYYPRTIVEGSNREAISIVKDGNVEVVYLKRVGGTTVTDLYAVQASGSSMDASNSVICINRNYKESWTSDCFNFNVSSPSGVVEGKLIIISMTVPNDGQIYSLSFGKNADVADLRVYERVEHVEHVYDNTCDTICNECNRERTITHTYLDNNDHNCAVCNYVNNDPTHVYDNDKDLTCNYCDYKRPQPRVWENLTGLSAFVIAIVVELATAITKSPLMLLAIVGIPCVGLGAGILRRLFSQRV